MRGPLAPYQVPDDRGLQWLIDRVAGRDTVERQPVDTGYGDIVAAARLRDEYRAPPHAGTTEDPEGITLTSDIVRRKAVEESPLPTHAPDVAASGLVDAGVFPHRDAIEDAVGRPVLALASTGEAAAQASDTLNAHAYAYRGNVAFGAEPSLHLAAHEAAHTLQSELDVARVGGPDPHEAHADIVADLVASGQSAAHLFTAPPVSDGEIRRDSKTKLTGPPVVAAELLIRNELQRNVGDADTAAQARRKQAVLDVCRSIPGPDRAVLHGRLIARASNDAFVHYVYERLDHNSVKEVVVALAGNAIPLPEVKDTLEISGFLHQVRAEAFGVSEDPILVDLAWIKEKRVTVTPRAKLGPPVAVTLSWKTRLMMSTSSGSTDVQEGTAVWDAENPAGAAFTFTVTAAGEYGIDIEVIAGGLLVSRLQRSVRAVAMRDDQLARGLRDRSRVADLDTTIDAMTDQELATQETRLRAQRAAAVQAGTWGGDAKQDAAHQADVDTLNDAARKVEWARFERGEKPPEALELGTGDATGKRMFAELPEEPTAMRLWFERALAGIGPVEFQNSIVFGLPIVAAQAANRGAPNAPKLQKAKLEMFQLWKETVGLIDDFEANGQLLMRELLKVSEETTHKEMQHYGFELKPDKRPIDPNRVKVPLPGTPTPVPKAEPDTPSEGELERAALRETIQDLTAKKDVLKREEGEARVRQWQKFRTHKSPTWIDVPMEDAVYAKLAAELETSWNEAIAAFPILVAFKEGRADDFAKLASKTDETQPLRSLYDEGASVLAHIKQAREGLDSGKYHTWGMPKIVQMTKLKLQIVPGSWRDKVIDDEAHNRAVHDKVQGLITGALTIALAVVSAGPTGGASIAAGVGMLALDAKAIYESVESYTYGKAASKTSFDPKTSLANEAPSIAWVVADCVAAGLDGAQLVGAFRRAAKLRSLASTAKGATSVEAREIRKGLNELAKQKKIGGEARQMYYALGDRVVEGAARAGVEQAARDGETIAKLARNETDALGKQLGTTIEIDDKLGTEVRVHYKVDKVTREVRVTGMKVGSSATVSDILLHKGTVALLERYNGTLGKLRKVWDDFKHVFGGRGSVPFPPGTQAFNSWHELQKLPELLEARQLRLGKDAALAADAESVLREDIEFFEAELSHHKSVVDAAILEDAPDFIAKAEQTNKQAVKAGYPKPPSKDYYYVRAGENSNAEFYLRRVEIRRDLDPLRAEVDLAGKPTGRFIEGELSRVEKAEKLIESWPKKTQNAFAKTKADAIEKYGKELHDVVPIKGIATTTKNVGMYMNRTARTQIEEAFRNALLAKGIENASAKAKLMVQQLAEHPINVIRGTDQLRGFGYRAFHLKGEEALGDLHHWLPLYLGGDHRALIDMVPTAHDALHDLIDSIQALAADATLAPSSIRNVASLNFQQGAAIMFDNGAIEFVKL